ncbi:MAG: hypothetical protein ACI8P3_002683, partial [Saprospiraceae bacterium]
VFVEVQKPVFSEQYRGVEQLVARRAQQIEKL